MAMPGKVPPNAANAGLPTLSACGHTEASASGQFRLDAARTSSSRDEEVFVIALAPGYGIGWTRFDPDAQEPAADIVLRPEQVIEGRLHDVQGRPAQGVVVSVAWIHRDLASKAPSPVFTRNSTEGPLFSWSRPNESPGWPAPATTDSDGRFTIHGIGRRLHARLAITDPRFARHLIELDSDDAPGPKRLMRALEPAKILSGRVTFADTGKRVPHARLSINEWGEGHVGTSQNDFQTDAYGRFSANPSSGDHYSIRAQPPPGQLYLAASKELDWPKGAVEQSLDLALPRGVIIRGKVVEEGTAQPIAGAKVVFVSQRREGVERGGQSRALTRADGSFEFAAVPSAGHLVVHAPSDDYVLRVIGQDELIDGTSGGARAYAHSFVSCEPKPGIAPVEIRVTMRRGVTFTGRVIGPDNRPVPDVWIIARTVIQSGPFGWRTWWGDFHGKAIDGRFVLHGLDPEVELPVYFLEPNRKLGAKAIVSGKLASAGALAVRLEPCGTARARLVDRQSRPVAGYADEDMIAMILTPGPGLPDGDPPAVMPLLGEADSLFNIDPINYPNAPQSNAEGRIVFPALIPGASYRVFLPNGTGPIIRKAVSVKSGEAFDLGDISIEKPPAE